MYEKFASDPHGYTDFTETQLVTTGEESTVIIEMLQGLRNKNLRSGGGKKFVNVEIGSPQDQDGTRSSVVTYCIDNTHQVVYDQTGTPLNREPIHLKETTTLVEVRTGDWRVSMIRNQSVPSC